MQDEVYLKVINHAVFIITPPYENDEKPFDLIFAENHLRNIRRAIPINPHEPFEISLLGSDLKPEYWHPESRELMDLCASALIVPAEKPFTNQNIEEIAYLMQKLGRAILILKDEKIVAARDEDLQRIFSPPPEKPPSGRMADIIPFPGSFLPPKGTKNDPFSGGMTACGLRIKVR